MVAHEVLAQGVDIVGTPSTGPVVLQMHAEDFPARFLQDLGSGQTPRMSSATTVDPVAATLFQPVQRVLHVALAQLSCASPGGPRLDPARVLSAGIVVRRVLRRGGRHHPDVMQAWTRSPAGRFAWTALDAATDSLDPDPAKRPVPSSGRPELDAQLAAIAAASASSESTSPAFVAPPATCTQLGETVAFGVVPTASSETTDATPAITYTASTLGANLPALLQRGAHAAPLAGTPVDFRWMSDEFLSAKFPQQSLGTNDPSIASFGVFSSALRMLKSTFGAFDGTAHGNAILAILDRYHVRSLAGGVDRVEKMGAFYRRAAAALIDYVPPTSAATPPTIVMPNAWDAIGEKDATALNAALLAALGPRTQAMIVPQGRYQDPTRLYRLRMFFRVRSEHPHCPPLLVWTPYGPTFRIAAWYENADRPQPPVPLPDPTDRNFLNALKPNCSFVVPAKLMGAMQGTSMSGLMNGAGGGSSISLNWICGFNIPLITICAFFVLNIFLGLLNIIFFWLPMIKICIPFPDPEE
ncbi:MAG TPA: hypothetical protein VHT53_03690 [Candidatus Elarobacter sp.]|jgi:hypothetical protein|nr:hypothetical protein [Candidatus Elarobacter sp.]